MENVKGKGTGEKTSSFSRRLMYEDFQPTFGWNQDPECHVLHVDLPGFKRDELKVKLEKSSKAVTVSGERRLNENRYSRFKQVFDVPDDSDVKKIRANIDGDVLSVIFPKKSNEIKEEPKEKHQTAENPKKDDNEIKEESKEEHQTSEGVKGKERKQETSENTKKDDNDVKEEEQKMFNKANNDNKNKKEDEKEEKKGCSKREVGIFLVWITSMIWSLIVGIISIVWKLAVEVINIVGIVVVWKISIVWKLLLEVINIVGKLLVWNISIGWKLAEGVINMVGKLVVWNISRVWKYVVWMIGMVGNLVVEMAGMVWNILEGTISEDMGVVLAAGLGLSIGMNKNKRVVLAAALGLLVGIYLSHKA